MVSRRVVLAGAGSSLLALGAGALYGTGRHDDVLRALGARPRPVADPSDVDRVRRAAAEHDDLLTAARGVDAPEDLVAILTEQRDALSGDAGPQESATPVVDPQVAQAPRATTAEVAALVSLVARRRADDAVEAVAPDLARVLASLGAGLAQVAAALGGDS